MACIASRVVPSSVLIEHNRIAARPQPVENLRQRFDGLRAIAPGIVQENDASVAALLFDSLQDNVGAGLRPILRIDVFKHDEIIQILRDLQRQ